MKPALILTTALTLTLAPLAFSQQSAANNTAEQSGQMSSQDQSHQAKEFVKDSASGNKMEVEVGKYIAAHTNNPQVKQYAETLVQDHTQSQQQLKQAAEQANVKFSDELTPEHKAMLKELKEKSGADMDRDFVFSAIADHHKDLLEFNYAAQHLQNQQLQQYAQQTIPTLQKHLELANQLSQSLTGIQDTSTATAR